MKMKMLILFFALHAHALIRPSHENDVVVQITIASIDISDLQLPHPQTLETIENIKFLKENAVAYITTQSPAVYTEKLQTLYNQAQQRPLETLDDATRRQIIRITLDKIKSQEEIDAEKERYDSTKDFIERRYQLESAQYEKIMQDIRGAAHASAQLATLMETQLLMKALKMKRDIFELNAALVNMQYNYKHASSPEEQNAYLEEYFQFLKNKPH